MRTIRKMPEGSKKYVKKVIPIRAIHIKELSRVITLGKVFYVKVDDYLIEGKNYYLSSCNEETFKKNYKEVDG